MLSKSLIHPNEATLFQGYRNPAKEGAQDIYLSIGHWFESEKFRGVDEVLREAVIQCPTPAEARKLAARHKDRYRVDWRLARARILKAGLMMAAEQNSDVRARMECFARSTSLEISIEFEEGRKICDLALNWYAGVMWDASDAYINRPTRVLFAAGRKVSYADKSTHVDKFVSPAIVTQVIIPLAKDAAPIGEQYAVKYLLPVNYRYAPRGKLTATFCNELASIANQILVMEQKGGKQFDPLIMSCKELAKSVKLTLV